jgi:hypothetical protein
MVCLVGVLFSTACSQARPPAVTVVPATTVAPAPFTSSPSPVSSNTPTLRPNLTTTKDWEQFLVTLEALRPKTATVTFTPTLTVIPTLTKFMTATSTPTMSTPLASTCQRSVTGIRAVIKNRTAQKKVNLNAYFSYLDHLSIEPGYTLDYVEYGDDLGGKPIIYARLANQKPYTSYEELIQAVGTPNYTERSYLTLEHAYDYLSHIRVDDTSDGFLQLTILVTIGGQFNLNWHGLYDDTLVMCDKPDVGLADEAVKSFLEDNFLEDHTTLYLSDETIKAAESLNMVPEVRLNADTSEVRMVIFTKWGGFIEYRYAIKRSFPHYFVEGTQNVLVEYDCGVSF